MRRFALAAAIALAADCLLAALPAVTRALLENLYVGAAVLLLGALALYAAVLVVMRVRRSSAVAKVPR